MARREHLTSKNDISETIMISGQVLRLDGNATDLDPRVVAVKFSREDPYRIRSEAAREKLYRGLFGTPLPQY